MLLFVNFNDFMVGNKIYDASNNNYLNALQYCYIVTFFFAKY